MAENRYEFIKHRLAPCGLHCGRCFAFTDGDIRSLCNNLKRVLGNFEVYAKRYITFLNEPIYEKYPDFKAMLDHLAAADCGGCRKEKCKIFTTCGVRPCAEEKKVDFCFQCAEFPCRKTDFDENLYKRHVTIGNRMKEIGVEQYYEEVKDAPRY